MMMVLVIRSEVNQQKNRILNEYMYVVSPGQQIDWGPGR